MAKLYSYIISKDNGAAPNPFGKVCTLTICKPAIRRTAQIGDWIIGTGSKNAILKDNQKMDFSNCIVYAMKISNKMLLKDYDTYCPKHLKNKIPNWKVKDWRFRVGDCVYDYSNGEEPGIRKSVHNETNRGRDLSGLFALLSDHFYYFGDAAFPLPVNLQRITTNTQGHRVIKEQNNVAEFENWIEQFERNKIFGNPQRRWLFDKSYSDHFDGQCDENLLATVKNDK